MKSGTMYRSLPRPQLRPAADGRLRRPIERFLLVAALPSPTADFYLESRLHTHGIPIIRRDPRLFMLDDVSPNGTFVVLCRYATPAVSAWLDRHSSRIAGVALFIDDDVPAMVTEPGAGLGYRLYVSALALWPLIGLRKHLDAVWVSTPELASRLRECDPTVLPPASRRIDFEPLADTRNEPIRIAYHAKIEIHHRREADFVRRLWKSISSLRPDVRLEITATGQDAKPWRSLPNVTIHTPSNWPAFRDRTARTGAHIALVPMLPSLVNDARAPTKRIDVARSGAAGVYSVSPAYGSPGPGGEWRLANEPDAWISAILQLIDDPGLRQRLAMTTLREVAEASANAGGLPIRP